MSEAISGGLRAFPHVAALMRATSLQASRADNDRDLAPILRTPLTRADHHRAIALVAEADASALQIVRRHLHDHPVADAGADAEFPHLARRIGEDLVVV